MDKTITLQGRCKDCRWWEDNLRGFRGNYGWKTCGKMEFALDGGRAPLHSDTLALPYVIHDGSGGVDTSPDFGCVMFENKAEDKHPMNE